uniref:NACHT domain-containing protein n=1 Tax=Anabas testudineus TaxID=64144 RepID=A0A7N6AP32_ANATE
MNSSKIILQLFHCAAQGELKPSKSVKLANIRSLKCFSEGEGVTSNSASHIEIRYTDLFVTEDSDLLDSSQHEYFDLASRRARIYVHQAFQRIRPCHLFSPLEPSGRSPKRVKVKGIAGIGKSVAVQRLLYEWAIGKSMREFTCVFDLRFRELNLIDAPLSLLELLGERFRYLKEILLDLFTLPDSLLFILDGLDEFKFPLDWDNGKDINVDSKVPVSELMVALIKGSLLPKASVILTTRPSTEAPKGFFQRCCVVLGFEERQVKEYTTKFYKDNQVAEKVYDYILSNDNLFVLSFIPLYCYIICTAMAEFFSTGTQGVGESKSLELNPPRTVSEVYFCYLFTAIKHHALKGSAERSTPRCEVLSLAKQQLTNLGKLAYENLLQKKIMFERKDLESYGVTPADVQSTFLCQILQPVKEETVEMFSFFHLTVQEHLAALYLSPPSSTAAPLQKTGLITDKLESLQMFTRFFMGMLRARLAGQLEGLFLSPVEQEDGIPTTLGLWFQEQFRGRTLENQTALNLLHCLMEFHKKEATSIAAPEIKKLNLFKMKLSVVDCAAIHYVLQFSPHKLQELNLGYSNIGNRGLNRLGPILHRCESLYIVGNDIGEVGKKRLRELEKCRPGLRIIANFEDDLGLLQAYLDWVDEIQVDKDQMDSVKNVDALQSVLKGLQVAGEQTKKGQNAEKAKELYTKITELLKSSTDLIGGR